MALCALVTATAFAGAPTASAAPDEASSYGNNPGHTGFASGGSLGAPPLAERWTVDLGSGLGVPIGAAGKVFVTSYAYTSPYEVAYRLSALDQGTGETAWWRPLPALATLAYDDGRVYFISGRDLVAVSAETGATAWARDLQSYYGGGPVAADGTVYVTDSAGQLLAFDGQTGVTKWQQSAGREGVPSLDARHVYVNSYSSCMPTALDRETGEAVWRADHNCSGSSSGGGPHVVADGARVLLQGRYGVVLDSAAGLLEDTLVATELPASAGSMSVLMNARRLQGRNIHTGVGQWEFAGDGYLASPPLVVNHVAYVGSTMGRLYAVDLDTGQEIWSSHRSGEAVGTPGMAAAGGLLLVPMGGELVAYEDSDLAPNPALDLTILAGPNGPSAETSATFTFTSPSLASTHCRLDAGTWQPCSGTASYADLEDGAHTFEVKTTSGGEDVALATRGFAIDTTPPDVELSRQTAGTHISFSYFQFNISRDPYATIECRLDGGGWTACPTSSPNYYCFTYCYVGLEDGEHRIEARATDHLGNTSPPSEPLEWTQDTVKPQVTISDGPPSPSYSSNATFEFEASEPDVDFLCRLDTPDHDLWTPCSSPRTLSSVSDGTHYFQVRAVDRAGNVSADVSRTWVVDAVDPETTITRGPEGVTRARTATFEFRSDSREDATEFQCRLDGSAWAPCQNYGWDWVTGSYGTQSYASVANGPHTFQVRAIDQGGSVDATPDSRSWTVDTTAPRAALNHAASGATGPDSARFEFSTSEADATFECTLDSAGWLPCSSPIAYTGLSPTRHTFSVRSIDALGNVDAQGDSMTIDLGPPGAPGAPPASTPEPPGGGTPSPPLVTAPPALPEPGSPRLIARNLVGYFKATSLQDLLGLRRLAFPYHSASAGRLTVELRSGSVLVGSAEKRFAQPSTQMVTVRIRRAARRLLADVTKARLRVEVGFKAKGGRTTTVTRRATTR